MTVVIHLITVIKWELFRKYHIKQCVFRGWRLKNKKHFEFSHSLDPEQTTNKYFPPLPLGGGLG